MTRYLSGLLGLLLVTSAGAQDVSSEREGGIPREMVESQRNRNAEEGTEDGLPSLRVDPGDSRVAPYVIPPDRQLWKLGVYAHYSDTGAVISRIVPGSPAQRNGLEAGDRIVSVNGYQVGWIGDRLYPLDSELQRRGGRDGRVLLLVQNVRTQQLLNMSVRLERHGQPYSDRDRDRRRRIEPRTEPRIEPPPAEPRD